MQTSDTLDELHADASDGGELGVGDVAGEGEIGLLEDDDGER